MHLSLHQSLTSYLRQRVGQGARHMMWCLSAADLKLAELTACCVQRDPSLLMHLSLRQVLRSCQGQQVDQHSASFVALVDAAPMFAEFTPCCVQRDQRLLMHLSLHQRRLLRRCLVLQVRATVVTSLAQYLH